MGTALLAGCAGGDNGPTEATPAQTTRATEAQRQKQEATQNLETSTTQPQSQINIISERFDTNTLTYDLQLRVQQNGANEVTVKAAETGFERTIQTSGAVVLSGLELGTILRFEPVTAHVEYIVGSSDITFEKIPALADLMVSTVPDTSNETNHRRYEWGNSWIELNIPEPAYEYCARRPRISSYGYYASDPVNDRIVESLADEIASISGSDARAVNEVIDFVQSLKYSQDSVTAGYDEYQRYPVETLYDRGGDCEDTAVLVGALLRKLGYGTKGVLLPGHMGVGVLGSSDISGTYYRLNGQQYYYVETTAEGWEIGELPEEYRDARAELIDFYGYPVVNFVVQAVSVSDKGTLMLQTSVANNGDAPADNVRLNYKFENRDGQIITGKRVSYGQIPAGVAPNQLTLLYTPDARPVRLRVEALVGNEKHAEWQSGFY